MKIFTKKLVTTKYHLGTFNVPLKDKTIQALPSHILGDVTYTDEDDIRDQTASLHDMIRKQRPGNRYTPEKNRSYRVDPMQRRKKPILTFEEPGDEDPSKFSGMRDGVKSDDIETECPNYALLIWDVRENSALLTCV